MDTCMHDDALIRRDLRRQWMVSGECNMSSSTYRRQSRYIWSFEFNYSQWGIFPCFWRSRQDLLRWWLWLHGSDAPYAGLQSANDCWTLCWHEEPGLPISKPARFVQAFSPSWGQRNYPSRLLTRKFPSHSLILTHSQQVGLLDPATSGSAGLYLSDQNLVRFANALRQELQWARLDPASVRGQVLKLQVYWSDKSEPPGQNGRRRVLAHIAPVSQLNLVTTHDPPAVITSNSPLSCSIEHWDESS